MKNYDRLMLNEVANSYRKMILNEAAGSGEDEFERARRLSGHKPSDWDYMDPNKPYSTRNPIGHTPTSRPGKVRVPKLKKWRDNPPEQWARERDEISRFRQGYKPRRPPTIPGMDRQIEDLFNQTTTTRKPTAPRPPAPKPGPRPIRGIRPAVGAAGAVGLGLGLWSIYQQLFGDDEVEVDVIPDEGVVIKPMNVNQPGLNLEPMQVPEHLRNPHSYPGQHPVRPPKAPAGGSQGSGGGIGGGGGMGL